jgi:hypothetical protein
VSVLEGGRWVELDRPAYATDVIRCDGCGVMIPRRYWQQAAVPAKRHCSPECVALIERVEQLQMRFRSTDL